MVKLTEVEKQELLANANSASRRHDFQQMKLTQRPLTPFEWVEFVTHASELSTEKAIDRPPMTGDHFLL